MLKFFRSIRKKLMEHPSKGRTGNKTRTYIFYAIGEILLVVIGILIALQVNNWNDQRLKEDRTRNILRLMHEELSTDILVVKNTVDFYLYKDSLITNYRDIDFDSFEGE